MELMVVLKHCEGDGVINGDIIESADENNGNRYHYRIFYGKWKDDA